jgi:hypothetical protein
MSKPVVLSLVCASTVKKTKQTDATFKMPTESTFTNRHEKKNNCKICAFAVLL